MSENRRGLTRRPDFNRTAEDRLLGAGEATQADPDGTDGADGQRADRLRAVPATSAAPDEPEKSSGGPSGSGGASGAQGSSGASGSSSKSGAADGRDPVPRRRPVKLATDLADNLRATVLVERGRGRPELTQNELLDEIVRRGLSEVGSKPPPTAAS